MAELLGAIASVAGLIQITTTLVNGGHSYISSFKRAREEMDKLNNQLKAFHEVLQKLNQNPIYIQPVANSALNEQLKSCLAELDVLQKKLAPPKGKLRFSSRLTWPLKSKETTEFLVTIDRYNNLFTLALTADQHCVLLAVKAFSENTDATVMDLVEQLRKDFLTWEVQKREEALLREGEYRKDFIKSLYPYPFNQRHNEISRRRQKHTGKWLLRHPEFQAWKEGKTPVRILWGYGIPGAGKTFLSSLVIDELTPRISTSTYAVAYIYFNYNEQDQQSPLNILSCLIAQLVAQSPDIPQDLRGLYGQLQSNNLPSFEELKGCLFRACSLFPKTYFIFDALDEAHERYQRKDLLPIFHDLALSGASLFLTGRPFSRDVNESLTGVNVASVELSAQEEDIKIYVEETIVSYPQANSLIQGGLRSRIIMKLVDCCKGMFLVVHFHIQDLCQYITPKQVSTALEALNESLRTDKALDGIYNRVMEKINLQHPSRVNLAQKVLSLLMSARRILSMEELRLLASLDDNDTSSPTEDDMPHTTMLVEVCAGLVTIDKASKTARLAHYSVKEYLSGHPLVSKAEEAIITSLISYVTVNDFPPFSELSKRPIDEPSIDPLLDYALNSLEIHLESCDQISIAKTYLKFLKNKSRLYFYQRIRAQFRFDSGVYLAPIRTRPDGKTKHNMGRLRPLLRTDKFYLHRGYVLLPGSSPLLEASYVGNCTVVSQLLEEGYNIRTASIGGGSPLHIAATMGYVPLALLLLENGCHIDIRDSGGRTPLIIAVIKRQQALVAFLLEHKASVNAMDNYGFTALHEAVIHSSRTLVRILLDAGADFNTSNRSGQTPIDLASEGFLTDLQIMFSNSDQSILPGTSGGPKPHTIAAPEAPEGCSENPVEVDMDSLEVGESEFDNEDWYKKYLVNRMELWEDATWEQQIVRSYLRDPPEQTPTRFWGSKYL